MSATGAESYDVAIVGGGPAGSSLAIRLARDGLRVVLLEKTQFPRPKLCGEFVSPECIAHLDELGVIGGLRHAGGVDIGRTVFYSRGGRQFEVPSRWLGSGTAMALGISRAEMDAQLLERARSLGVVVLESANVKDLLRDGGLIKGVEYRSSGGGTEAVSSELIVDATGRTRSLARLLGEPGVRAASVAFKAHLTGAGIDEDACEIYSYNGGYGGCSRVEKGLSNICFITSAASAKAHASDPVRLLREVVMANARAEWSLRGAEVDGQWLSVPIARYGSSRAVLAEGVVSVGDAAAFIDPFTGSGMLLAFEGARILADIIVSAYYGGGRDFDSFGRSYERAYSSAISRRLRISSVLRRLSRVPAIADAVILGLAHSGIVGRRLARATRAG